MIGVTVSAGRPVSSHNGIRFVMESMGYNDMIIPDSERDFGIFRRVRAQAAGVDTNAEVFHNH
jgi:hypothetical protein